MIEVLSSIKLEKSREADQRAIDAWYAAGFVEHREECEWYEKYNICTCDYEDRQKVADRAYEVAEDEAWLAKKEWIDSLGGTSIFF